MPRYSLDDADGVDPVDHDGVMCPVSEAARII